MQMQNGNSLRRLMCSQGKGGAHTVNALLTLTDLCFKKRILTTNAGIGMSKAMLETLKFRECRMGCLGLERRAIKESFIGKDNS